MNQSFASSLKIVKKTVSIKDHGDVHLFYPEEYENLFLTEYVKTNLTSSLSLARSKGDFRQEIVIRGITLLVAFFGTKKEVLFSSRKLGRELLILDWSDPESADRDKLEQFCQKIVTLPVAEFPSVIDQISSAKDLPDLDQEKFLSLESSISQLVAQLLKGLHEYKPTLFERLSDFGLAMTAQYTLLRLHLLKFLAVLPGLDHDTKGEQVKRILLESFRRLIDDSDLARKKNIQGEMAAIPQWLYWPNKLAIPVISLFPARPLAILIRGSVRLLAKRFIAGETIELAEKSFTNLAQTNRDITLDQLGELVVSSKEADHYCEEVLKLINGLGSYGVPGAKNKAGIYRAHVSIKVTALCADFRPEDDDFTFSQLGPRLYKILSLAKEKQVFINIDAEHYHFRDAVWRHYQRVLLQNEELKSYQQTGIVLQAYLRDASDHLDEIIAFAKKRGHCMPIRIVKGAYWDAETIEAQAHQFEAPEFLNKEETDIHFRQLMVKILAHHQEVQLCLASHNYADHCFAVIARDKLFPEHPPIEHQCLHMTYEALSVSMAKMGWAVRNYVPVGSLLVGMAYLVRRIMENSSQVGVLTIMRSHKKAIKLRPPQVTHRLRAEQGLLLRDHGMEETHGEFRNVPPLRTYLPAYQKLWDQDFKKFQELDLGKEYQNEFPLNGDKHMILSPSDPSLTVGSLQLAKVEDAQAAIKEVHTSFKKGILDKMGAKKRAGILLKAAEVLFIERNSWASLIVFESGKAILEALADVDEAIDFLQFYAREEVKLDVVNKTSRGPCACITPWNFPLAIPCGMISSALVAGNPVILKSAEQTPLIATRLVHLLHKCGFPKETLIHLPGPGETIGQALVDSPKIATYLFTGSRAIGVMIATKVRARLYTHPITNEQYPVRAITEMGGKNAIIVTGNAEIDETVAGIIYSCFAHAGQKCSAASRILVNASVKDTLVQRLKEACLDLQVGRAMDWKTFVNPIISKEDCERLKKQAQEASQEANKYGGMVHVDRSDEEGLPGYCVGPVLIELPYERALHAESWAQKELFGPVIHLIPFQGLEDALKLYNSTPYGLTGGVFSQSQDEIDFLTGGMENGNIYINRSITGARVGIEPFGGFKMSGTGPKAGGVGYVEQMHRFTNTIKWTPLSESPLVQTGQNPPLYLSPQDQLTPMLWREMSPKLVSFGEDLADQLPSILGHMAREGQTLIREFMRDILRQPDYLISLKSNCVIPGQISANTWNLKRPNVLILAANGGIQEGTLIHLLWALGAAGRVTILCRDESSFVAWNKIISLGRKNGLLTSELEATLATKDNIEQWLNNYPDRIILGGDIRQNHEWMKLIYHKENFHQIWKVLSLEEGMDLENWREGVRFFAFERSLAINIMRHGAPLEGSHYHG